MKDSDREAQTSKHAAIIEYRGICEGKATVYAEVADALEFHLLPNVEHTDEG